MVRYLSALFASTPDAPALTQHADSDHQDDGFMKLDNEISISREKIEIGTVLYDRRSSPTRAASWFTRVFSFIKEWRAMRWVETFVSAHRHRLPGGTEFVSHIRQQGGVRRDEFIDFLIEQRLNGLRADLLASGVKKSVGDYRIHDIEGAIMRRLSSAIGTAVEKNEIDAFFSFIDGGCIDIPNHQRRQAGKFVASFTSFATVNPNHPLVSVLQGKVNLMAGRLKDDETFFDACKSLYENLPELDAVKSGQAKIYGWDEFRWAIDAGAKHQTEYHPQTEVLHPLDYADSFLEMVENQDEATKTRWWPDPSWTDLVNKTFHRYAIRESRLHLADFTIDIDLAIARKCTANKGQKQDPQAGASLKALQLFFDYCVRGPVEISRFTVTGLRAVTERQIRDFCLEVFSDHPDREDIANWADNLFVRLQEDLETFEAPLAIRTGAE